MLSLNYDEIFDGKRFLRMNVQYVAGCVQDWFYQHMPSVAPNFRPYVHDSLVTKWYRNSEKVGRQHAIWEMWLVYYMQIEQLYTVYNNLVVYTSGRENCLCINRREIGLHFKRKGNENLCRLMTVWKEEYVVFPNNTVRLQWDGSEMGNRLYY